MKILLFTDNHFCASSSIINKQGNVYTLRLENQIKSLNWVNELGVQEGCDKIICLGDFFDKPVLSDQELTALNEIDWKLPADFIVGNHESTTANLFYSSTVALRNNDRRVIFEPTSEVVGNCELCYLPYIVESDRKTLADYFGEKKAAKRIILSHNDIKGIQMGPVISRSGFDIDDIESSCDLFLNGHLHNGTALTKKVINLGNLTGQNFGEDATRYPHKVMILDTETYQVKVFENPFAFNFYQIEIDSVADIETKLANLKPNPVISFKCKESVMTELKAALASRQDIVMSRTIVVKEPNVVSTEADIADLTVDHLAKFIEFCRGTIAASPVLEAELAEVCK